MAEVGSMGVMSCKWDSLTPAEQREIDRHKYFLSEKQGFDVGLEAAARDWLTRHAEDFQRRRQEHMLGLQREEISRHIWIESERHQCDMRREAALEWIKNYAASWRQWYEKEYGGQG
jgi:hypothetical protein